MGQPVRVRWTKTISLRVPTSRRANQGQQTDALHVELQDRPETAGVDVLETRLTHLAYAPGIAGVMLRRQQAEAIAA